jgi:hypothetical protein
MLISYNSIYVATRTIYAIFAIVMSGVMSGYICYRGKEPYIEDNWRLGKMCC